MGKLDLQDVSLASLSDVGRVRKANEDSCGEFEHPDGHRLLVLADGMGGHQGGATASQFAVKIIGEAFTRDPVDPPESFSRALSEANARILEMASESSELRGMGTTVVCLLVLKDASAWVAHVGDSRAYRFRGGNLEPMTEDHSVVATMLRQGFITAEDAEVHPRRNEILRSVGVVREVDIEVQQVDLEPGDLYLLCSDGLNGLVRDPEIEAVLRETSETEVIVRRLVDFANDRGGTDNITVQAIRLPEAARPAASAGKPGQKADLPSPLLVVGLGGLALVALLALWLLAR